MEIFIHHKFDIKTFPSDKSYLVNDNDEVRNSSELFPLFI